MLCKILIEMKKKKNAVNINTKIIERKKENYSHYRNDIIISKLFDPYFETDDNILTEIIINNEIISKIKKNKKLKGKK